MLIISIISSKPALDLASAVALSATSACPKGKIVLTSLIFSSSVIIEFIIFPIREIGILISKC